MRDSNWSQDEIDFLKRCYPTASMDEMITELGRTSSAITTKACALGVKKINPNSIIKDGKKRCSRCGELLELSFFYHTTKNKNGYSSFCKICKSRKGKTQVKNQEAKDKTANEKYVCSTCHETKPGWKFKWSTRKQKRETRCSDCCLERERVNKVTRIKEGRDW